MAASPWLKSTPDEQRYPVLGEPIEADVVVVGGGVFGVLTAWRLARHNVRVVLLEQNHIATGDTAYTTAFATRVPDTSLAKLAERYGGDYVKQLFSAASTAQEWLRTTIHEQQIDCGWQDCWSYECSYSERDASLSAEWAAVQPADPRASLVRGRDATAANPAAKQAIRFDGEARFDARAALFALLKTEVGKRIQVFEETTAQKISVGPSSVEVQTPSGLVRARTLVVATGKPLEPFGAGLPVLRRQESFALSARYGGDAPISDDLFWDTDEPYQYYRRLDRRTVILGGADRVSGHNYPERPSPHEKLELFLRSKLPGNGDIEIVDRWSGSMLFTKDGVPIAGRHPAHRNVYLATGFGGNGMVMSALASGIIDSLIRTGKHAASKLLAPTRLAAEPSAAPSATRPTTPTAAPTIAPATSPNPHTLIATLRILLPLVAAAVLVAPALAFFGLRGTAFLVGLDLATFSRLMFPLVGLYAFTLLWMQFMLGTSMYPLKKVFPWIERFHRTEGVFVLLFALLHPTLLLVGVGGLAEYFGAAYVRPELVPWLWVGEIQLTLLFATVGTALLRKTRLVGKFWRYVHVANYVVFALAWLHSWNLGTDVQSQLAWLWYFFGATALVSASARIYRGVRERRGATGGPALASGSEQRGTGVPARTPTWIAVATAAAVTSDAPVCITASGKKLALFKVDGNFYAISNTCSHQGGPLCEGSLKDGVVTCPWHQSQFSVRDGNVVNGPALRPIQSYKTRVHNGSVEVLV